MTPAKFTGQVIGVVIAVLLSLLVLAPLAWMVVHAWRWALT